MLQYLLDTDHLTLFQRGHATLRQRLALQPAGAVGIGVVTVEESLRGRLARLARAGDGLSRIKSYRLLVEALLDFAKFPIVPYDQPAEDWFQQLHTIRIGTQDRKIGAIA